MNETNNYMTDAERQAWLTSARAWGAAFPQFADLVARIEARLIDCRFFRPASCNSSCTEAENRTP